MSRSVNGSTLPKITFPSLIDKTAPAANALPALALSVPASAPLPVRVTSVGFASSKAAGYERAPKRPYPKRRSR